MLRYLKVVNMVVSIVEIYCIKQTFILQFNEILFVMNYRTMKPRKDECKNIHSTHTKVCKS